MRSLRTTIVLFCALVALYLIALFLGGTPQGEGLQRRGSAKLCPGFMAEHAHRIELVQKKKDQPESRAVIEKKGGDWSIPACQGYPADAKRIDQLLKALEEAKIYRAITQNKEKWTRFRVDEQGTRLQVYDADGARLASLFVGKSGADYQNTCVRLNGSKEVVAVTGSLRAGGTPRATSWLDKELMSFDREEIAELSFVIGEEKTAAKKNEDGSWEIVEPKLFPAKTDTATTLTSQLCRFRARDILPEPKSLAECGLDEPTLVLAAKLKDGTRQRVSIGGVTEDQKDFYAREEGSKWVYLVPKGSVTNVKNRIAKLADRDILPFAPRDAAELTIRRGPAGVRAKKGAQGEWTVIGGQNRKGRGDARAIEAFLKALAELKCEDIVRDKALEECGLAKPEAWISVRVKQKPRAAPGRLAVVTFDAKNLLVGTRTEDALYYVKGQHKDRFFLAKAGVIEGLLKSYGDLREKKILSFKSADVTQLQLRYPDHSLVIKKRADGQWQMRTPTPEPADEPSVNSLLSRLAALKYRTLLEAAPRATEHGFDNPPFAVGVTLKDGTTSALTFGKAAGDTYFANVGEDETFLVPKGVVDALKKTHLDFKERTIFAFDHRKVTQLAIEQGASKLAAVRQDDGTWQIVSPRRAPCDRKMLERTLTSFASLRADKVAEADERPEAGFDQPSARLAATFEDARTKVLLFASKNPKGQTYVKRADAEAVYLLNGITVSSVLKSESQLKESTILQLAQRDLAKLILTYPDEKVELKIDEKKIWEIADAAPIPVDQRLIQEMVGAVCRLRGKDAFFAKEDLAKYGLDKPTFELTVELAEDRPGETVLVGSKKENGDYYATRKGSEVVYVVSSHLIDRLMRRKEELRDRSIVSFPPYEVMKLAVTAGGEAAVVVAKEGADWRILEPEALPADSFAVNALTRLLPDLRYGQVVAGKKPADCGLEKPSLKCEVTLKNGSQKALLVGKPSGDRHHYAKIEDEERIFTLPKSDVDPLSKSLLELVKRTPFERSHGKLTSILVESPDGVFEAKKLEGKNQWQMLQPQERELPARRMSLFNGLLANLRADSAMRVKPETDYGLDKPTWKIVATLRGEEPRTVLVGNKAATPTQRHARVSGIENIIFLFNETSVERLLNPLQEYLAKPKDEAAPPATEEKKPPASTPKPGD